MENKIYNILLADDDEDDCTLFIDALKQLPLLTNVTIVNDGEALLKKLAEKEYTLPDIIFLDLNMPLKNGFECLSALKSNATLQNIPVVVISTSRDWVVVKQVYDKDAAHYIQKPDSFSLLKNILNKTLNIITEKQFVKPLLAEFVIQ